MRNLTAALFILCVLCLVCPLGAAEEPLKQYRAFWVDTFNTSLNNHDDVVAVVRNAQAAGANAIFAQVRRRGDSWYLDSLEPIADRTPIAEDFDPLLDLISEAHSAGVEVHAYVIVCAIWNRDPRLFPPTDPNHVFNLHGFNQSAGDFYAGRDNWLTKTFLPDGGSITYQGHRIGADFWIDLGHPDAAAYTFDVLMHLVRNYDIDGLHLDRIRYPDLSVPGQTPATGTSIGYNETNVERFQLHYGNPPGSPPPAQNDPLWNQWRRDQVTNFVRRVYLNAIAIKPHLKISASLIAFGGGPINESDWALAEAYWRVYQDWRAWTEEGILDIAVPMNYKREDLPAQQTMFDSWNEWAKNHQYNRATIIGQGAFLNAVEGSLRQIRRSFSQSALGNSALGVSLFSMATSNTAVTNNPFSIPPNRNTPVRLFAEFASGLLTGKSVDGTELYEDPTDNPDPVFAVPAEIPDLPWKTTPDRGHLMGIVSDQDGNPIDAAEITIFSAPEHRTDRADCTTIHTTTDGNGFYGGVDLLPGKYGVTITPADRPPYTPRCRVRIRAGRVSSLNVVVGSRKCE